MKSTKFDRFHVHKVKICVISSSLLIFLIFLIFLSNVASRLYLKGKFKTMVKSCTGQSRILAQDKVIRGSD
jgi:hypothetical protein